MAHPDIDEQPVYGVSFWIGLVIGWAIIGFGLRGVFGDPLGTVPPELARWTFGLAVAHDAILAPLVTIIGLALAWILPRRLRGPVLAALAASGIVMLFSWPLLRGYGKRDNNSSKLPHDYVVNVGIVLAVIWGVALVTILVRWRRAARAATLAPVETPLDRADGAP